MYCNILNDQPFHSRVSPANVSGLFPILRSTKISSGVWGNWGNWSSCHSVRIDRRLLSHQLILLMFDHCALLTHLRFQLLQPLRKFFHPDSGDVPKHSRRLPGSAVATTSSATMCGRETERDFFSSPEPLKMGGSSHSLKITVGRRCTCLSSKTVVRRTTHRLKAG